MRKFALVALLGLAACSSTPPVKTGTAIGRAEVAPYKWIEPGGCGWSYKGVCMEQDPDITHNEPASYYVLIRNCTKTKKCRSEVWKVSELVYHLAESRGFYYQTAPEDSEVANTPSHCPADKAESLQQLLNRATVFGDHF